MISITIFVPPLRRSPTAEREIPTLEWQAVDAAHYDLNTCLREAIVLLKSFLMALPNDELKAFQATVQTQMGVPNPRS